MAHMMLDLATSSKMPWYAAPKKEVANALDATAQHLWTIDTVRLSRIERYFRLYGGSRALVMRPWEVPSDTYAMVGNRAIEDALRLNVVKSAVDTITSKVGKLRPRPTFLTTGGDWKLKERAKKLQRFMDGAYHQSGAYELGPDVFRDAMIFGTGIVHVFGRAGKVAAERVPSWELFTDIADAIYGNPRCLYRIKWVSCNKVAELYGVETAASRLGGDDATYHEGYVAMVESWCLPHGDSPMDGSWDASGWKPDAAATYGRHTLMAGDKVIVDEPWCQAEFPFVFIHWSKPIQGFWGDSAVREVVGMLRDREERCAEGRSGRSRVFFLLDKVKDLGTVTCARECSNQPRVVHGRCDDP